MNKFSTGLLIGGLAVATLGMGIKSSDGLIVDGWLSFTGSTNRVTVSNGALKLDGTTIAPSQLTQASLTHAGTVIADFTSTNVFSLTATGNVTIASTGLQTNRTWRIKITAPASQITATLPAWNNFGTALTLIEASKTVMLSAEAWGPSDTNVWYATGVQP